MAGRPKGYERDAVLERAMGLFWKKGFEGAHLAEIVELTGLNRFSLYKEFGGKEGLFREALNLYLDQALTLYESHLAKEPLGLSNILDYFEGMAFGEGYHGCFMVNTLGQRHVVSDESFAAAEELANKAEALFLRNLRAAQNGGELPGDRSTKELSRVLSALDQGLATYGILHPRGRFKRGMVRQVRALFGQDEA